MSILDDEIKVLDSIDIVIKDWVDKYCKVRGSYSIHNNEIYVDGTVTIFVPSITRLPYKFKKVTGRFDCDMCLLTTLENCPDEVGSFSCTYCKDLISLKGGPKKVFGAAHFEGNNKLKSLEGAPEYIGGEVICYSTGIRENDWDVYKHFHCKYYQEFHPIKDYTCTNKTSMTLFYEKNREFFYKKCKEFNKKGEVYFCCDHI